MMRDHRHKLLRSAALLIASAVTLSCTQEALVPAGDRLTAGTWGGSDAGLMVSDSVAHAHIGCTFGDFPAQVAVAKDGRFSVAGSYVLRAYPIQVGPSLPAQFAGIVRGDRLTLQVTVNDTVEKQVVVKGPVTVTLGREPELGPCPICRKP